VTFKSPTYFHLQKTCFNRMMSPQNQINCRKNEIRILFRSQDIQVGRLKWDILCTHARTHARTHAQNNDSNMPMIVDIYYNAFLLSSIWNVFKVYFSINYASLFFLSILSHEYIYTWVFCSLFNLLFEYIFFWIMQSYNNNMAFC